MADDAQGPITTIPPFSNQQVLPACASSCGPLYNANGACVPPAVAVADGAAYESCFCAFAEVTALSSTTAGVCDNVCEDQGLNQIATWFQDLCGVSNGGSGDTNGGGDGTGGDSGGNGGTGEDENGQGGQPEGRPTATGQIQYADGGDWLSNHWQWVVMLAVLVVAIAGIWVGACIWRRRYLKKKERQMTWAKKSGSAGPEGGVVEARPPIGSTPPNNDPNAAGSFMPSAQDEALEKGKKKRWFSKDRA